MYQMRFIGLVLLKKLNTLMKIITLMRGEGGAAEEVGTVASSGEGEEVITEDDHWAEVSKVRGEARRGQRYSNKVTAEDKPINAFM